MVMEAAAIIVIVNGNTYRLRASDTAALAAIPRAERQQLIALLGALQQQDQRAEAVALEVVAGARPAAPGMARATPGAEHSPAPERLGSGDVDALMARLIMEENRNRKPGLTKQVLTRWVLAGAVVFFLLALLL